MQARGRRRCGKCSAALCELVIDGIPNNIEEQIALLGSAAFTDGSYHLGGVETQ